MCLQRIKIDCQASDRAELLPLPHSPSTDQGISSWALDNPWHATRLVATQQSDEVLHSIILSRWLFGSFKALINHAS